MTYSFAAERTLNPRELIRVSEVGMAPKEGGIYAWWFTPGALSVPAREYAATDGFDLLYTGISPRKPNAAGKASTGSIRSRLRSHVKRDASWSTLRLSLGILLADDLGLKLALYAGRAHWGTGEEVLTEWMRLHARVSWVCDPAPWTVEEELLAAANVPLNIDQHLHDPFSRELNQRRIDAKAAARS